MSQFHDKSFPGETEAYRSARDKLLEAEIALRKQTEEVAVLRRELPLGGPVPEDYAFEGISGGGNVKLSELFEAGKDTLVTYSLMFAPGDEAACPMCTSLLDGLNGSAPHINDRVNFAVIAKAPPEQLANWAAGRGWINFRLLSSNGNDFNPIYLAEDEEGGQWPMINVFRNTPDGVFHSWGSELFYSKSDVGHSRHADTLWPLWNMFDLTPEGRGTDWFPKLSYS